MVWQGSAGDRRPYADLTGKPAMTAGQVTTNAIVADDSSALPDQPGDRGLALSGVGSGLVLPHRTYSFPLRVIKSDHPARHQKMSFRP